MLELIKAAWKKYPDIRLGQLITNCITTEEDLFYIEDDKLFQRIECIFGQSEKEFPKERIYPTVREQENLENGNGEF